MPQPPAMPPGARDAVITFVNDGDTLKAILDLELGLSIAVKIRLEGINAPNMNNITGQMARHHVSTRMAEADAIAIKPNGQEKYGRWLGTVYWWNEAQPTWVSLNQELLDAGLAVEY